MINKTTIIPSLLIVSLGQEQQRSGEHLGSGGASDEDSPRLVCWPRLGGAGAEDCGGCQAGPPSSWGRAQNLQSRGTELHLKEVGGGPVSTRLGEEAALSGLTGPSYPLSSFWCLSL